MKYDREYQQNWRRANPGWRHKLYGEDYRALLKRHRASHQAVGPRKSGLVGDCGLCGKQTILYIDHDHGCCDSATSCGKCVRGLLCSRCNYHVAWIENNIEPAFEYLGWTLT
jgi:hypothetical protein